MKKVLLKQFQTELEIESQLERKGLLHHAFGGEGNNQVSNVFSVTTIHFANIGRATENTF